MKKFVRQILLVLILAVSISARSDEQKITMVDEFGKVSLEDLAARLDYLGSELDKNPTNKAVIRIYGGQEDFFAFPYIRGSVIKAYLKNNRKLPAEDFSIQLCNVNQEPIKTQFFIVNGNEKIELCNENPAIPKETVLFESLYFYWKSSSFWSEKPFEETSIDVVSPSEQQYSQFSQNALLNLMDKSPESKIYLIGYFSKKDNKRKDNWAVEKELIKGGINKSRIIKIDGGYQDSTKVIEIRFVPKGGEIPKSKLD
jgi:hypothetical protein